MKGIWTGESILVGGLRSYSRISGSDQGIVGILRCKGLYLAKFVPLPPRTHEVQRLASRLARGYLLQIIKEREMVTDKEGRTEVGCSAEGRG